MKIMWKRDRVPPCLGVIVRIFATSPLTGQKYLQQQTFSSVWQRCIMHPCLRISNPYINRENIKTFEKETTFSYSVQNEKRKQLLVILFKMKKENNYFL